MAIITNYPNVPIVTTNVATDSVRNDNEHKSSVAPTDKVNKLHEERAIDPEKEHDSNQQHHEQQHHEQQHRQSASTDEDDVSLSEELEKESVKAQEMLAVKYAALSRKDIKIYAKATDSNHSETSDLSENENVLNQEDVKQVKKNLNSAYQTQESKPKSKLSEWG
ncbi:hypothetical protein JQC92_03760 [Shewanella sp. 202IG2-18]|uniref:hypothetical protein n=1 Tax=Parashewanella hymeniacidonis TaxID=2807618 RepID=UPI00195F7CED|nr:hypothetical protein [Parashewanella hymeniacidonis]MBM7071157.1 hypothetical protein [Parashewanella hymeniacidonis]